MRALTVGLGTAAVDAAALVVLRPRPGVLETALAHPRQAVARHGADAALLPVVGALVWCAAAWLALGLLATCVSGLPGWPGRFADAVARRLLPRALRGLLAGSAGLGVLLAPAAALAHGAQPVGGPLPAPAWPVAPPTGPAPVWPTTAAPAPPSPSQSPTTTPTSTPTSTPPPAPSTPDPVPQPRPPAHGSGATVTVSRGDSLWSIAADRLGPRATPARVSAAWPRWFAANRAAIGDDPDLIRPGQVLQPPPTDRP